MLPIFISEGVAVAVILRVLAAKAAIGVVSGFLIDGIERLLSWGALSGKRIHDLCEAEHCGCDDEDESIVKSAFVHTIHIAFFLLICTFVIGLLVELLGEDRISGLLMGNPYVGVFISALIGLIPNCAASVIITNLYLHGLIGVGQMMAGLLVGAGAGLLVLFRTNRRMMENLQVVGLLYICGVVWGCLIQFFYR